jgi:hypothetical protein
METDKFVIAGLDPAIHLLETTLLFDGYADQKGVHARLRRAMPAHGDSE